MRDRQQLCGARAEAGVGQALHKLSLEHSDVLQREGGLAATLLYIDFFDINTQRTAAATAANMCRNVPAEELESVVQVVPALSQLLSNGDQKMVESGCLAFSRLVLLG
jgi:E3 ubiquitin-protein ligase TRIP12